MIFTESDFFSLTRLLSFEARAKVFYETDPIDPDSETDADDNLYEFRTNEPNVAYETELTIVRKFQHVDIEKVWTAQSKVDELLSVLKKVHPWSSLR